MKILPPTRTRTRPAAQVEHLAAWLREWQIDRQLPHPAPERAPFRPRIGGRRIPLRPGEIRLLRPESETAAERPIYLAVLELDEGTGDARAFPFSRFTCPAVPGEIRISGPIPALRVLCCWNELRPDRERLERAWPVSELDPADCFAALQLLASPAAGTPSDSPPERLLDRVGPPLLHPCDPRHVYLQEEETFFRSLKRSGVQTFSPFLQDGRKTGPSLLAADPSSENPPEP